jgi:hypothetical protein
MFGRIYLAATAECDMLQSGSGSVLMLFRKTLLALSVLLPSAAAAAAEPLPDTAAWRVEVTAARARAEQHRASLKAEYERRKALRALQPRATDQIARARIASEQVLNDFSLQPGDIVSTLDGMFVFNGDEQGVRSPESFTPADPGAARRTAIPP